MQGNKPTLAELESIVAEANQRYISEQVKQSPITYVEAVAITFAEHLNALREAEV